jgi:hypothetical protein
MAYSTPRTWADGPLDLAALNQDVRDNVTDLHDRLMLHGITSAVSVGVVKSARYGVSLTTSGTVNLADQSDVQIQFDTEEWDDATFHSTVSNTQRITIPAGGAGTYTFTGHLQYQANASGFRELWLEQNAATEYNRVRFEAASSGFTALIVTCELELVAGDYVVLRARQNSGSTLTASGRLQARRWAV